MNSKPCRRTGGAQAKWTVCAAIAIIVLLTCLAASPLSAGTFAPAAPLAEGRYWFSAATLANGKVLVAGGNTLEGGSFFLPSAELYDPATNTWSSAGSLSTALAYHTATRLPNGKVLLTGGCEPTEAAPPQLYDPATNTWSYSGTTVPPTRLWHTATLLPDGRVLLAGGRRSSLGVVLATAALFDPATNAWLPVPNMRYQRLDHTSTLLPSGEVLVVGGRTDNFIGSPRPSSTIRRPTAGRAPGR